MPRQKHGFLLFICSLIPGAGEMYMGLFKQGISIMTLFWVIIALAGGLNLDYLVILLPVIWFYSFFHVHNLKDLPEEEFYAVEDNYILHLDLLFRDTKKLTPKYQKAGAILLIIFGVAIFWNSFSDLLYWIIPGYLGNLIQSVMYHVPPVIVAILIILAGFHMLTGKLKTTPDSENAPQESRSNTEHYWQPYRPYQQPINPSRPAAPQTPPAMKAAGVQLSKKIRNQEAAASDPQSQDSTQILEQTEANDTDTTQEPN